MTQQLDHLPGKPAPGTLRSRPRYAVEPDRGPLTREERLTRQLAMARWQRGRWQRRCIFARQRVEALERRRAWAERYVGFRIEYWLRGAVRRARRLGHVLVRRLDSLTARWTLLDWLVYSVLWALLVLGLMAVVGHIVTG